ncbi:MAG: type II toxin-antitoxin system MqsA family antitoxin [Acidobacteriota bacterium]
MKCVICKQGNTTPGKTTVTLERDETVIVFRGVPAEVCDNCGEAYLDEAVTKSLLQAAAEAAISGVEVDIRQFTAASQESSSSF